MEGIVADLKTRSKKNDVFKLCIKTGNLRGGAREEKGPLQTIQLGGGTDKGTVLKVGEKEKKIYQKIQTVKGAPQTGTLPSAKCEGVTIIDGKSHQQEMTPR